MGNFGKLSITLQDVCVLVKVKYVEFWISNRLKSETELYSHLSNEQARSALSGSCWSTANDPNQEVVNLDKNPPLKVIS